MTLHSDWKAILMRAWSVRFAALAAFAAAGEAIVQAVISGVSLSVFGLLLIAFAAGAAGFARVVVQQDVTTKVNDA